MKPRLSLIPSIEMIRANDLKDKHVVIIDVLRATSVITTALANGAAEILPVLEVEDALCKKTDGVLLGGERKAMRIEGFDLSNSPLEYKRELVEGKTIVLSTTNGTKAIHKAIKGGAATVIAACMLNANAAARNLIDSSARTGKDIAILCSGTYGNFSIDDYICAGKLIHECVSLGKEQQLMLQQDDFAKAARLAYEENKAAILDYVKEAAHYEYLMSIGLQQDLNYCFEEDRFAVVPSIEQQADSVIRISV